MMHNLPVCIYVYVYIVIPAYRHVTNLTRQAYKHSLFCIVISFPIFRHASYSHKHETYLSNVERIFEKRKYHRGLWQCLSVPLRAGLVIGHPGHFPSGPTHFGADTRLFIYLLPWTGPLSRHRPIGLSSELTCQSERDLPLLHCFLFYFIFIWSAWETAKGKFPLTAAADEHAVRFCRPMRVIP